MINFRRRLFDWETELLRQLKVALNSIIPCKGSDSIIWTGDPNGRFSVKILCAVVEIRIFGELSWKVPKKIRTIAPPKVVLFVWQLLENRIAVKGNLIKRGVVIENGGTCDIFGFEEEVEAHLMLRCMQSWRLWCSIMAREDIYILVHSSLF